jgi:hypothetical protein
MIRKRFGRVSLKAKADVTICIKFIKILTEYLGKEVNADRVVVEKSDLM